MIVITNFNVRIDGCKLNPTRLLLLARRSLVYRRLADLEGRGLLDDLRIALIFSSTGELLNRVIFMGDRAYLVVLDCSVIRT